MNFRCDKITHKELADGTIRLYVDTGEYEYDNVLSGLQELRKKGGRETSYKVQIEIENAPSVQSKSENEYKKLWSLIEELATIQSVEKEALEARLKQAWSIDSFTELSKEDKKQLENSIQEQIDEEVTERLSEAEKNNR